MIKSGEHPLTDVPLSQFKLYPNGAKRCKTVQNGVTTTYENDANNRLLKETVAGAVTSYDYDANGNLINAWNAGNPVGAYAYNLFGNQTSFTADGVVFTNYTYRPDGLRHSIGDKVHVWDGENIVADIDGSNVIVYIRGVNLIYADDGDKSYYHVYVRTIPTALATLLIYYTGGVILPLIKDFINQSPLPNGILIQPQC